MTSFCFFVQLADRALILKQKEFFVFIIAIRLLLNHSPSEWFSVYNKKARNPVDLGLLKTILEYISAWRTAVRDVRL